MKILLAVFLLSIAAVAGATQNSCNEDLFLKLSDLSCKSLDKDFGFDKQQFNGNVGSMTINLNQCNEVALKASLETINEAGGGTLKLPSCVLFLSETLFIPSNTVVQGAGTKQSILVPLGSDLKPFKITNTKTLSVISLGNGVDREIKNVILRDFTLQSLALPGTPNSATPLGSGGKIAGLYISKAENVLVEQVEVLSSVGSGISLRHSSKATIRYSDILNSRGGHGIGIKDCWLKLSMDTNDNGLVSRDECIAYSTGMLFSHDIAIYSNRIDNSLKVGIDSHADNIEITGNIITNNKIYGSKLPEPSTGVWFHDNYVSGNTKEGINAKTQYDIADEDMYVTDHIYYRNLIFNNGGGSDGVSHGARTNRVVNAIFLDNIYVNNGAANKPNIGNSCGGDCPVMPVKSFICEQDNEVGKSGVVGTYYEWLDAYDERCDINNVSNIFE